MDGDQGGAGSTWPSAPARLLLHRALPDLPADDCKTLTAILYIGNRVEAWGWSAWRRRNTMDDADRTAGGFTYIDNFKLLLQWQSPAAVPAAVAVIRGGP
ncbi:hypothetical protein GPECTOR_13g669 [Gonium pectorale]|uniref:Uncharacterized protein n=1 Tax=Gonium pectorale TaxID=33097 RepID=A0A150GN77_GONPE|nr:hypothetical protein GPECTOR_13g669 [Gonium pectorale]|eukprot:KXZ51182.1 hypothetical protein GPECTOR_13g669 [Gonium pectorale]